MPAARPLAERFEEKVDRSGGPSACHPWLASTGSHGYGQIRVGSTVALAHRVAWELAVGPIPAGYEIDHVSARGCAGGRCCNLAHLEPVAPSENLRRQGEAQVTCLHGHPFTAENTYRAPDGYRRCRECRRQRRRVQDAGSSQRAA